MWGRGGGLLTTLYGTSSYLVLRVQSTSPAKCVSVCFPLSVKGPVNVYVNVSSMSWSVAVCQQWSSPKGYPLSTSANPYQIRVCWYGRHVSFFIGCACPSGLRWAGLSLEGGGGLDVLMSER